ELAGGEPAQAQRRRVAAKGVVRREGRGDEGRVLRHAVVHSLTPITIGPAVEAALAHRGEVVGRRLVAEALALVDDGPEHAGARLPRQAHGVAQAGGEDAAAAGSEVELVDAGAARLRVHALVGDVGERADAGIEPASVGARQKTARPVAAGLEGGE